jgi:hypothetical protein
LECTPSYLHHRRDSIKYADALSLLLSSIALFQDVRNVVNTSEFHSLGSMEIHTVFGTLSDDPALSLSRDLYEAAENGKRALFSPSSSAASKFELGHTADAAPKEPHVETAALVEVQEKEKPHIEGCSGPKEQAAPDPDKSGISPHDGIKIDEHVMICISIKDQSEDLTEWLVHHTTT